MTLEPWIERLLGSRGHHGLRAQAKGAQSPPCWAWRTDLWSQSRSFSVFKSNGICPVMFWIPLGPTSLSSFWLLPSGVGMSNPPLRFGSAPLVWFHSFTAGEEFRMNQTSSLSNFSAIEMRFGTPSGCWKVLKLSGMLRWVECILHVRGTWILGGPRAECYGYSYVPPNSNLPLPCTSEGDLVCK